jgi:hypothetical protein
MPSINNITNSTDIPITGELETGNMNIGQGIAVNEATIGGIGAGVAAVAIIVAAVAYSIFSKKVPIKKGKKKGEAFSEMEQLAHTSPLPQRVNITRLATQAERINITSLPLARPLGLAAPPAAMAAAKVSFNPVSAAAAKAIGAQPAARAIQQAMPLDMYRAHNVNLDRMSVKRPPTNVKLPMATNESRVGFQPVRKDYKPQLAKTSLVPKVTRAAQLSTIGK